MLVGLKWLERLAVDGTSAAAAAAADVDEVEWCCIGGGAWTTEPWWWLELVVLLLLLWFGTLESEIVAGDANEEPVFWGEAVVSAIDSSSLS